MSNTFPRAQTTLMARGDKTDRLWGQEMLYENEQPDVIETVGQELRETVISSLGFVAQTRTRGGDNDVVVSVVSQRC